MVSIWREVVERTVSIPGREVVERTVSIWREVVERTVSTGREVVERTVSIWREVVERTVSIWRVVVEKIEMQSLQGKLEVVDYMIPHGKHIVNFFSVKE